MYIDSFLIDIDWYFVSHLHARTLLFNVCIISNIYHILLLYITVYYTDIHMGIYQTTIDFIDLLFYYTSSVSLIIIIINMDVPVFFFGNFVWCNGIVGVSANITINSYRLMED